MRKIGVMKYITECCTSLLDVVINWVLETAFSVSSVKDKVQPTTTFSLPRLSDSYQHLFAIKTMLRAE